MTPAARIVLGDCRWIDRLPSIPNQARFSIKSGASGQKNGQSDQKRNVKKRRLKYGKNKEWILIFKRKLDRINRIIGIKRPSAERAPRRRRNKLSFLIRVNPWSSVS
jgi:hypothetical protein